MAPGQAQEASWLHEVCTVQLGDLKNLLLTLWFHQKWLAVEDTRTEWILHESSRVQLHPTANMSMSGLVSLSTCLQFLTFILDLIYPIIINYPDIIFVQNVLPSKNMRSPSPSSHLPIFPPSSSIIFSFRVPVFREYLLGLGVNSVSKASIHGNLTRGPGASVMIVIGGERGRGARARGIPRGSQGAGENPGFLVDVGRILRIGWIIFRKMLRELSDGSGKSPKHGEVILWG